MCHCVVKCLKIVGMCKQMWRAYCAYYYYVYHV